MDEIPPMGECDVKFTRWARMLGDLIAHSVDGDFIPIALMEHEKQANDLLSGGGQGDKNTAPTNIALFRIEYNMEKSTPVAGAVSSNSGKRARSGEPKGKPVTLSAVGGKIQVTDRNGEVFTTNLHRMGQLFIN